MCERGNWTTGADFSVFQLLPNEVLGNCGTNCGNFELEAVVLNNLIDDSENFSNVLVAAVTTGAGDEELHAIVSTGCDVWRQVADVGLIGNCLSAHAQFERPAIRAARVDNNSIGAVLMNSEPEVIGFISVSFIIIVNITATDR